MKKAILALSLLSSIVFITSCSSVNKLRLSDYDAAAALKQMLEMGVQSSVNSTFDQQNILASIFPESVRKTLNTVQQLGLSRDLDQFTVTLAKASRESAERSVPVFLSAIDRMSFTDAIHIIKSGGTAGTDYMRNASGAELRLALRPVMQNALEKYHLNELWNKIINDNLGGRINLDLPNLMAGMVSEKIFRKMADTEIEIRNNERARTTPLLRRVFSGRNY
jgi:hypothetical protein